jgi:hypothetical protein
MMMRRRRRRRGKMRKDIAADLACRSRQALDQIRSEFP